MEGAKDIKCVHCGRKFDNEDTLLKHIVDHTFEPNYYVPCLLCPQKFKNVPNYKKHRKNCMPIEHLEENSEETFWQCNNCPEKIKVSDAKTKEDFEKVKKHCSQHSRKKEIVFCPIAQCNKFYHLYTSLNRHLNDHIDSDEFDIKVEGLALEGLEQNAEQQGAEPFIENDSDSIIEGTDTNLNVSLAGSESSHENIQETVNLPVLPSDHDMCEMSSKIEDIEALFALKVSSKHLLSREVVNEIFLFSEQIHARKIEYIKSHLLRNFANKESVPIQDVTNLIDLVEHSSGLGDQLETHLRREKVLKSTFKFIKPELRIIGKKENVQCFYYSLPVHKTLNRLIRDKSVRSQIVHQPVFFENNGIRRIYRTFSDGNFIKNMKLSGGPYILFRLYLDAFCTNGPIGSSSDKHKV